MVEYTQVDFRGLPPQNLQGDRRPVQIPYVKPVRPVSTTNDGRKVCYAAFFFGPSWFLYRTPVSLWQVGEIRLPAQNIVWLACCSGHLSFRQRLVAAPLIDS